MKLQDIFDHLSGGELSQVFVGDPNHNAGISEADRPRITRHISLGLTELHKRFLLREQEIVLLVQPGKQSYHLDARYAVQNTGSTLSPKFLDDAPDDPLTCEVFRVERAFAPNGERLALNELGNPASLRTTMPNMLLLPDDFKFETVKLVCRVDHEPIKPHLALDAPEIVDINLPSTHLWALLLFVASRFLNPVGMVAEFHEGNNYLAKFEQEVVRLRDAGFQIQNTEEDTRFQSRGFA